MTDYMYELPEDRIALYPLPERDASKLLISRNKEITSDTFKNIHNYLPDDSILVFNDTRVLNARIKFKKESGAVIEIFCLEPAYIDLTPESYTSNKGVVQWNCLVGGAAKWKKDDLAKTVIIDDTGITLTARMIKKLSDSYLIEFTWNDTDIPFTEVLNAAGDIPLPPYIKRETDKEDIYRYQTIYANNMGSVAAPTAGLHFTDQVFNKLSEKNIRKTFITLHVGAGTFKPVKSELAEQHEMHAEWINADFNLLKLLAENNKPVIAVGTTSVRTLESLYWLGVKLTADPSMESLQLDQWEVYQKTLPQVSLNDAFNALITWLQKRGLSSVFTRTKIMIVPGYKFKVVNAIITNFHQPGSTLLLLVSAAAGNDWRKMYDFALENDYRFLSYGDSNLVFIDQG